MRVQAERGRAADPVPQVMSREAEVLSRTCPKCGAGPRQRCRNPRSSVYVRYVKTHPERKCQTEKEGSGE